MAFGDYQHVAGCNREAVVDNNGMAVGCDDTGGIEGAEGARLFRN